MAYFLRALAVLLALASCLSTAHGQPAEPSPSAPAPDGEAAEGSEPPPASDAAGAPAEVEPDPEPGEAPAPVEPPTTGTPPSEPETQGVPPRRSDAEEPSSDSGVDTASASAEPPAAASVEAPPSAATLSEFVGTGGSAGAEPCSVQDVLLHGNYGYVACGTAGVWVCRHAPQTGWRLDEVVRVQGMAVGLSLRAGQLQVDVVATQTASLSLLRSSPTAARPRECTSPTVESVERDGLLLTVEPEVSSCLRWRDHVALLDASGEVLAVARVHRGRGSGLEIVLGYHEQVDPADVQQLRAVASGYTSSRLAPMRAPYWSARFYSSVLLSGGPTGGMAGEVGVERVFKRHAFLRAEASPLAFAAGESFDFDDESSPAIGSYAAVVLAGLDTWLFGVGGGLGVGTMNFPFDSFDEVPAGTGTVLPLVVRLGARDGLNIALRGDTTFFRGKANFSFVEAVLSAPVHYRAALQFRGRGGPVGVSSGEIVTRVLMRGNGGPRSTHLELGIGGGAVSRVLCEPVDRGTGFLGCFTNRTSYAGVMFGVGVEQRF